jgi:hypothetical protein
MAVINKCEPGRAMLREIGQQRLDRWVMIDERRWESGANGA